MALQISIAAALLLLLLAQHPFVTYPLSLRVLTGSRPARPRPAPTRSGPDGQPVTATAEPLPRLAICLCAYNEAAVIERKIANLLALRTALGELDILVYVDAASDRTAALLQPYAGQITLIVAAERRGKTHGMNLLAQHTRADILVFTDANVMVEPGAMAALRDAFADPAVGCACGHLIYTNGDGGPTAQVGSFYWRLEESIKDYESQAGSVVGADGSLFAVRRHLHRPVPADLIDDMFLSLSILCDGYQVIRVADARAYEEAVTVSGEEFQRKIRIACQAFNVHRRLWPRLKRLPLRVRYMYVSHKFLRWIAIYNLVLAGGFCLAALLLAGLRPEAVGLLVAGAGALFLAGLSAGIRPVGQIAEILSALAGAGWGVWRSLCGRRFQTWSPAASIRSDRL